MATVDPDNGWRFAQCFGDKGEIDDVTEGVLLSFHVQVNTKFLAGIVVV